LFNSISGWFCTNGEKLDELVVLVMRGRELEVRLLFELLELGALDPLLITGS
jgi:hypothetical protein